MNCRKIKKLLVDYYKDSLLTSEKEYVERHLESCLKCKEELLEIKKTFDLLNREMEENPEEIFWTNFLPLVTKKIESIKEGKKLLVFKPQTIPLVISFLAVLVMGTFLFTRDFGKIVLPEEKIITFYPLYSYTSPVEELLSELPSEKLIPLPEDFLGKEDEDNLTLVENTLEEEYWGKEEVSEMLKDLSLDQLEIFEKRLSNIQM